MNFHQLFNTYRAEFSKMHVYRIKTFLVRSLNNEAKYRQLAFIEIILIILARVSHISNYFYLKIAWTELQRKNFTHLCRA